MIQSYNVKVIEAGPVVEVITYETPILAGYQDPGRDRRHRTKKTDDGRSRRSWRRAKNKLRRLVNANFDTGDKFISLTHADNVIDLDEANTNFKRFIQRLKRWVKKETARKLNTWPWLSFKNVEPCTTT